MQAGQWKNLARYASYAPMFVEHARTPDQTRDAIAASNAAHTAAATQADYAKPFSGDQSAPLPTALPVTLGLLAVVVVALLARRLVTRH